MCGRFYVDDETAREIERMIQILNRRSKNAPVASSRRETNNAEQKNKATG